MKNLNGWQRILVVLVGVAWVVMALLYPIQRVGSYRSLPQMSWTMVLAEYLANVIAMTLYLLLLVGIIYLGFRLARFLFRWIRAGFDRS